MSSSRPRRKLAPRTRSRAPEQAPEQEQRAAAAAIFVRHASFCRVFSDEKRLRIMWFLGATERTVSEIAAELGISLQNTSQHLRIMRDKGAVTSRREGQTKHYRISNAKFLAGCRMIREALLEELDRAALDAAKERGTKEPGTKERGTKEPGTKERGTKEPGTKERGTKERGTKERGTKERGTKERGAG